MGNLGIGITCKRCGKKSPISGFKYTVDGKSMVCADCYARQHSSRTPQKPVLKKSDEYEPQKKEFESFICSRCRYKFRIAKNRDFARKCPYCGDEGSLVRDEQPNASDLLKESDGFE